MSVPFSSANVASRDLCIPSLLETMAVRNPAGITIAAPGRPPLTYSRLYRLTHEVRAFLNEMGVGRNDRVAVVVPTGPEMAAAFLAVAASATCAPLNPAYRASEFEFYLSDLGAKALIIQSGIDSPAITTARQHGIAVVTLHPRPTAEAGAFMLSGEVRRSSGSGEFAHPSDTALVLHTSGTTARPKLVPLTQANVCTSAYAIAATLELSARDRCLNVMPLYHIHGLVGATLATLVSGASIFCPPGFDQVGFFAWLEEFRPSWFTAVPTIHQAILSIAGEYTDIIMRYPLRFIRSCSAPLPIQVMAELERVFNAPVIEAYGMTEAAHQISSNPLPPGRRMAGSVGVPTGTEVAIMDEADNLMSVEAIGEIVVRGPNVTRGYENHLPTGRPAFVHGWFRTGDQGYLDSEGYLFIKGRFKEIINRGGEKISPREIEEVLFAHPAVAQAVVFGIPHSALGEDVAAAVVVKENSGATEGDIRRFAAARLADFRVPSRILIVANIPKGATGKIQRTELAKQFGPLLKSQFVAPSNPLERELAGIWARELGVERVGTDDNFFELGGTSLLAVRMFAEIHKLTGQNLPPTTLLTAPTVKQLVNVLSEQSASGPWPSLVAIQPKGSRPPFICVHGLGGDVLFLRHLARHLGPDQPFYALRQQGLDGVRPPHTRIEDMATHYVQEVVTFQPEGPYFLGGYSFGGLVVYEMAQQLCTQGRQVAFLALIDTHFWNVPRSPSAHGFDIEFLFRRITFHLDNITDHGLRCLPGYILEKLMRRFAPSGARPPLPTTAILSELPPLLLELERLDEEATKRYVPRPYGGRTTLFLRRRLDSLDRDDHRVPRRLFLGGIEIHKIPGGHLTVVVEPHVRILAKMLRASLDKAMLAAARGRGDRGGRAAQS